MAHQPWRVAVPCLSRCRARLADGADESKLTFLQALIIFLAQLIWSQGLPGPHTYSALWKVTVTSDTNQAAKL